MPTFLSPEWITALDEAATADHHLAELTTDVDLVVEQRVTDTPDGTVTFHVVMDRGTVRVVPGSADEPTVRFTQDLVTAVAIATGRQSAQRAFMSGHLQVGGDTRALVDLGPTLAALGDTFASVRNTAFPDIATEADPE